MERLNTKGISQSSESGMSLIEVMVSTIVLGVVLVGLGQALTYGIKVNNESKLKVATLNACKYLTENSKTQISQSQASFDATAASDTTYYVDYDGNRAYYSAAVFQAHVVISDTALTKTVGGVTSVLVKVLDVSVVDLQNASKPGHQVEMRVEIIRPSA